MYACYLFCIVIFIPHLNGNSISTPSANTTLQYSNNTAASSKNDLNITKVVTEGGSEPEKPVTLPKDNHPNLISLDNELGKTKGKSVVPRKGVKYNPAEDNVTGKNPARERIDTTIVDSVKNDTKVSPKVEEPLEEPPLPKSTTKLDVPSVSKSNTSDIVNNNKTTPVVPAENTKKKPLVLSAERIVETEKKVLMANAGSSAKPTIHNQIPLPKAKYEKVSTSSHPGMIMPIVITMLVVPMFAVLGYMALRRGQEAWKNRHYKRMDFLLDGMYND